MALLEAQASGMTSGRRDGGVAGIVAAGRDRLLVPPGDVAASRGGAAP